MKKYNLDPRTKLVIVIILSTLGLIYKELLILFLILITSIIIAALVRSNLISIVFKLRRILGVLFAIAFFQSVLIKAGEPIISIGNLALITDYGIRKSIEFILRISIIITSSTILTTSSSREIVQALIQLKIPYEIAFMVSIAARFLPLFMEELKDMIVAIQLRGIDLKKVKLIQKVEVYKYIFLPIIINSFLKAKELSAAMEMRGLRAFPYRSSYLVLEMKKIDYIIIVLSIILTIMIILLI